MLNFRANITSTIWRYYAFEFLENAAFMAAVLVPFYTEWGRISVTQIQILQSWFMFWLFVSDLPTGVIADLIGRKWTMVIGASIITIASLIYGSIPDFRIFLLAEFLFGIGLAFISGADQALLYDALKEVGREEESKKIMGRADVFKYLGMLISAPIGSLMAAKMGLNSPMLFSAIPLAIAAFVALTIREPLYHELKKARVNFIEAIIRGFDFLRSSAQVRNLAIDAILVSTGAYFVIWFNQLLLIKLGVPVNLFGLFYVIMVISEIVISANFSRLEKLFGVTGFLHFSAIVTGIAFIVAALFPSVASIIIFLVFGGGFGLTRLTFMIGHINQFIPTEKRATILSSISLFRRLALVVVNPLAGFGADRSLPVTLMVLAVLPLSVGLFSLVKSAHGHKKV